MARPSSSPLLLAGVIAIIILCLYRQYIVARIQDIFTGYNTQPSVALPVDRLLHIDVSASSSIQRAFSSGRLHNLTPCRDDACVDYANLAVEVKAVHADRVREFASATPRAVFMVWAPWCRFCEIFMPEFLQAAVQSEDTPFALVNAELVDPSLFAKDGGIFEVTGFPTFVLYERPQQHNAHPRVTPLSDRPSRESLLALAATSYTTK